MRSNAWIRHNGQAEVRANLANLIADDHRSRAEIARQAGIKYSRLTAVLNSNGWLDGEQAVALANVFGVTMTELLGDSLLPDQRDRFQEFDYSPGSAAPSVDDDDETLNASRRTRALCCACGTLRLSRSGWTWGFDYHDPGQVRLVEELTCRTCDATTKHALLNLNPETRNSDESADRTPTAYAKARAELDAAVVRIGQHNVDIHFRRFRKKDRAKDYICAAEFDESKSRWRIELHDGTPPALALSALDRAWKDIATDDWSGIDFNPRKGVMWAVSNTGWVNATNDLMDDIERALSVERRRLVQHVTDSVDHARFEVDQ